MANFSPVRLIFLICLIIVAILSCVAFGVFGAVTNNTTNAQRASIAFNAIALILILAALVIYLVLMFTCEDNYKILMIVIVVLTGIALVCFAKATGTAFQSFSPPFGSWLLAAVWTCIIAFAVALILTFFTDDF